MNFFNELMNIHYKIILTISFFIFFSCSVCDEDHVEEIQIEEQPLQSLGFFISAIECDSDNNIFIGVEYPGTVYKLDTTGLLEKTNLDDFSIRDLMVTSDNVLYASRYDFYNHPDSSLIKSTDSGDTWNIVDIPEDNFQSLIEIPNNILIAGVEGAIYHSTNGKNWLKTPLPLISNENKWASKLAIDENGSLWIEMKGGMRSYLLRYNLETSDYKYYGVISHVNKILISEDNDVFIAHQAHDEASGSISRILSNVDTVEFLPIPHTRNFGLPVTDLDFYEGSIIAATGEGIMFSDDKCESWEQNMPDSFFTALEVDNKDIIYAGTSKGFLVQIDGRK